LEGVLLTRSWSDSSSGLRFVFWLATDEGPARVVLPQQEATFFIDRAEPEGPGRRRPVELTSFDGRPVDAVSFSSQRDLLAERDRMRAADLRTFESDVKPHDRYLMERFVTGAARVTGRISQAKGFLEVSEARVKAGSPSSTPELSVASLDIETDGFEGGLLSIAIASPDAEGVWVVGEHEDRDGVRFVADEASLIGAFLDWVREHDPDVLLGWNVVDFDLRRLEERCLALNLPFTLGRAESPARVLGSREDSRPALGIVPGRVVLDGISTLRGATWSFESWSLEAVGRELLGRGKRIHEPGERIEEIRRLHREEPLELAAYNLEDCRLVLDIAARTQLVAFALKRQQLTGLAMDRPGGSVAAFDNLYLPRLHRHGHVAVDVGSSAETPSSPGGHVLDSVPGLHENVLVLDFKSLYPSIIRTFRVDPMGLAFPGEDPVEGFDGGRFARERSILPGLIEELWSERDAAKRSQDAELSRAIKILMNSFYGVLGTPGCRFFDPRLASSITRRGHEMIERSREFVEKQGPSVIYGDTDSVFVLLGAGLDQPECMRRGDDLAAALNEHWRSLVAQEQGVESFLEIEFETCFERFLMPTMRGSGKGSKKRYAGLVRGEDGAAEIVVKGLEAVRTDWTPLARRFQTELLRRVFCDEPFEDWVREIADELRAGKRDEELVYRKRLRRRPEEYDSAMPPHVKAALKSKRRGSRVEYLITVNGPEPLDALESPIDHEHYLEKQLAPAADVVLPFRGTDFDTLAGRQMKLF
jgi:DNA polymerase-2